MQRATAALLCAEPGAVLCSWPLQNTGCALRECTAVTIVQAFSLPLHELKVIPAACAQCACRPHAFPQYSFAILKEECGGNQTDSW